MKNNKLKLPDSDSSPCIVPVFTGTLEGLKQTQFITLYCSCNSNAALAQAKTRRCQFLKFIGAFVLVAFLTLHGVTSTFAGSFNGSTSNINPSVANSGGMSAITSLNNNLNNTAGEVGVSTFTSSNYYLYSGKLQAVSYPLRITAIYAAVGEEEGEITLLWTAPGADGTLGTCTAYDIRYSTAGIVSPAIAEEIFQNCLKVSDFSPLPELLPYGYQQSLTITGLSPGATYYFAIKAMDTNYSWSFLSNGATQYARTNYPPYLPSSLSQYNLLWQDIGWGGWTNFTQIYTTFTITDYETEDLLKYNVQFSSHSDFSYLFINSTYPVTAVLLNPFTTYYMNTVPFPEGTWYWRINATDDHNHSGPYSTANSGNPAFRVDVTLPDNFNLSLPADDSWSGSNEVTFQWAGSGDIDSGLSKYQLYVDGELKEDNIASSKTSTTTYISHGSHNWYLKVMDVAGNERQSSQSWIIKVDTTSPASFDLSSPADDFWSAINGVTFQWTGSGDGGSGLNKYRLYVDGELKEDNIAAIKTSTTTYITEGSHNWYVRAVDSAGNERQSSQSWIIKVDTTSPDNFDLSSPADNAWLNSNGVTFQWAGSGDSGSGLGKYRLYIDGELKEDNIMSGKTSTTTYVTQGSHSWYVKAMDVAGNELQSSQSWTVNVDTSPSDNFNLSSPADNAWLNSNGVTFQWTGSGDGGSGLSKYRLYVDDGLKEDNITPGQISTTTYVTEGSHSWYIKAIDVAGNERQSSQSWIVKVDTTSPDNFSLNSPADNAWLNSNGVTFQWTGSGDGGSGLGKYRLYVDGELKEDNIASGQISTTTCITEGSHSWYVKAVDNVGNQEQSIQDWTVKVDTTLPYGQGIDSVSIYVSSVTVNMEPANDILSGLSGTPYSIRYSNSQSFEDSVSTTTVWFSGTSKVLSSLVPDTTYYFQARAVDIAGNISVWSAIFNTVTLCSAPEPEWGNVSISSITIGWPSSSPDNPMDTAYIVEISTLPGFGFIAESTITVRSAESATISGLSPNTTYYARLTAKNHSGQQAVTLLNPISRVTLCSAPNPGWGDVFVSSMTISWSASSPDNPSNTIYEIELSTSDDFTSINKTNVTTRGAGSTVFSSLSINANYYARIIAQNWEMTNSTVTLTSPEKKSTLCNSPTGAGWGEVWISSLTIVWTQVETPSNPADTVYVAQVSTSGSFYGNLVSSATLRSAGSIIVTGLNVETTYYGRVAARNRDYADAVSNITGSRKTEAGILPPFNPSKLGQARLDNGSLVGWGIWTNELTLKTTFYISDPNVSDTVKFRIQASTTPAFSMNVIDYSSELMEQGATNFVLIGLSNDSTYYWRVKAIDNTSRESNWSYANSGDIAVRIDTASPTSCDLTSPADNEWTNTDVVFNWTTANDYESGISKYQLYVDSGLKEDDIPAEDNETTSNLTEGVYSWFVKAIDEAGNQTNSNQNRTVRVDGTLPDNFGLNSPDNNSWSGSTDATFQWEGSGDSGSGLSKYRLYVDGELKEDNIASGQTSTTTYITEGSHSWYVKAVDSVDNQKQSGQAWTVNVDVTPPDNFGLSSPADNIWLNSKNVTFQWEGSGDSGSGLSKYRLYVDGELKEDNIASGQTSTTTYVTDGSHSWYVKAVDNIGSQKQSVQTWTVNVDETPPDSFNLGSPEDNSWSDSAEVAFQWAGSGDIGSGLSKYQLYMDDELKEDNIASSQTSTTTYVTGGSHNWYVKAVDGVNNQRQSSQTRTVKVDIIPPDNFDLSSPADNSWTGPDEITFQWSGSGDSGSGLGKYQLYIDGELKYDSIPYNHTSTAAYVTGGSHSWYIKVADNAGNQRQSNQDWTVKVDTNQPNNFDLSSPEDNFWSGSNEVTFQWSGSGDNGSGLSKYRLYIDGELMEDNIAFSQTSTTTYVTGGSHSWYVKAVDSVDNQKQSGQARAVNVDVTPPDNYDLSLPADNSWSGSNEVTFQWSGSGDSGSGLSKYRLYIDGELKEDNIASSQTSTTTYVTGGSHSWYVNAVDNIGNQRQSNQVMTIKVDVILPDSFDLGLPADNSWSGPEGITFQWAGSGDSGSGLSKYQLYIDGELEYDNIPNNQTSTTTYVTGGSHSWYVKAVDNAGNQRQSNQTWTVKGDVTPPDNFDLSLPADNFWSGSNEVTFQWAGSEDSDSGLGKYRLYIDGELEVDNIPSGQISTMIYITGGSHSWCVKAVDNAGNEKQSSQNWTIKVDVTPPDNFNLSSPANNVWVSSGNVTFQWASSGDSGSGLSKYQLFIDGELEYDDISYSQTSTTTYVADGSHSWYVKAVDNAGNERQSVQARTVKVDTTPPAVFNLSLPANTIWLNSNDITFQWDNSEDNGSGLAKYQLFVDGELKEDDILTNQKLIYIQEGSHSWYVKAVDNAGNERQSSQNWTVNIEIIESGEVVSSVLPKTVNQGGHHEANSANNELSNSLGETGVCLSTYTSTSYYLFSGFIQTIAYPGTITAIAVSSSTSEGEITLSWTSPGSDGTVGICTEYDIRYSTQINLSPSISEEQFQNSISVSAYSPIPAPLSYKTPQNMTITSLILNTTYYFAVKSRDSNYCWSFLSRGATAWVGNDNMAPAQIVDLSASSQLSGDVVLSWTAPGDNLWSGKISTGSYRIDYSTFTKSWNYEDYRVNISTHNVQPYAPQSCTITGLEGGVTYYFRIWTADERTNWSSISDASTCQVHVFLSVDVNSSAYDFGTIAPSSASISLESINIQNKGNARQSYKLLIVSEPNATWQSVTNQAPGAEEYRFSGIFRSSIPAISDFSIEDAFSVSADRSSSQSNLAFDAGPDNEKGFNVPVGITRKLWFKFESPVFTEITTIQSIPVRIMAIP